MGTKPLPGRGIVFIVNRPILPMIAAVRSRKARGCKTAQGDEGAARYIGNIRECSPGGLDFNLQLKVVFEERAKGRAQHHGVLRRGTSFAKLCRTIREILSRGCHGRDWIHNGANCEESRCPC